MGGDAHGKHRTDTCGGHLKTHGECHLFTFKPFHDDLGNRDTGCLTAYAEDGIAQRSIEHHRVHAGNRVGHVADISGDGGVLDGAAYYHDEAGADTREAHAHTVENNTAEDEHQ